MHIGQQTQSTGLVVKPDCRTQRAFKYKYNAALMVQGDADSLTTHLAGAAAHACRVHRYNTRAPQQRSHWTVATMRHSVQVTCIHAPLRDPMHDTVMVSVRFMRGSSCHESGCSGWSALQHTQSKPVTSSTRSLTEQSSS